MYGAKFAFQNRLGQPYSWKEIYRFCFVLLCKVEGNILVQAPGGLYLEGRFNGGFFALPVWGLVHGGAYFWNFMVYYENKLSRFHSLKQPVILSTSRYLQSFNHQHNIHQIRKLLIFLKAVTSGSLQASEGRSERKWLTRTRISPIKVFLFILWL